VFISSTMRDLMAEREAVAAVLQAFKVFDVLRAESFAARADPSQIACISAAETASLVILILGRRYGFVPNADNPERLSVTHLEYRAARARKVPVLAFVQRVDDRDPEAQRFVDEVEDFATGVFRLEWETTAQLTEGVARSTRDWLVRYVTDAGSGSAEDREVVEHMRARLSLSVDIAPATGVPDAVMEEWLGETVRHAQQRSAGRALPPLMVGHPHAAWVARRIHLTYGEGSTAATWHLRVQTESALSPVTQKPPIDLDVVPTEEAAAELSRLLQLLVLLEAGVPRRAIAPSCRSSPRPRSPSTSMQRPQTSWSPSCWPTSTRCTRGGHRAPSARSRAGRPPCSRARSRAAPTARMCSII
jgi:hypothetical protein